ncbi:ParB/RepB/Spo0J family partition protein [Paradesulfitobacterium ferrireducens]|uniref:ParB/RepB/Spo0J family partition protein n=1 Tax=Paradesulfitobacterium ferrireducens TaxID=2816476 RepID=UPI001A8E437D|nr:ParB/RepB/Spo0J family partition protein [Paradesulfitobacterium ferrireducens]
MAKKGLGRGLEALIPDEGPQAQALREIALADIEPNPDQPRREFDEETLKELGDSIREHGLLQPILVRPNGSRYMIIAGERRFRASKLAGMEKIPVIVQECSELEMTERALVENVQRANLSPVEEGLAYRRLMEEFDLTQEQVAQKVGKGRPTVANLLRIIQLPEPVLKLLREEKISLGHAKVLMGLEDSTVQVLIADKAAREQLSVRAMEELLNNLRGKKEQPKVKKAAIPALRMVEDRLRELLQTKVRISGSEERGKIEIEFFSQEELNRLLELWKLEV